ncbi:hypothetical protein, partial [Georgenia subflava]
TARTAAAATARTAAAATTTARTAAAATATAPAPGPGTATPAGTVLVVDLRVSNGTDGDVNTSIFVAMTSGGADAEPVYDTDAGLTGPPGTMLPPGGEVTFVLAFEAKDPDDLVLDVQPAYHYDPAVFAGSAG